MIKDIMHVGMTVKDIDRSIAFYRDILGLNFEGRITMEGPETDALFGKKNSKAEVAYLKRGEHLNAPPVELICFTEQDINEEPSSLFKSSISEICFETDDIWKEYERLKGLGVEFLSEPQNFDFTSGGFGKSIAVYFKDHDGIIQELMQCVD